VRNSREQEFIKIIFDHVAVNYDRIPIKGDPKPYKFDPMLKSDMDIRFNPEPNL